jgi:hypothetical protein
LNELKSSLNLSDSAFDIAEQHLCSEEQVGTAQEYLDAGFRLSDAATQKFNGAGVVI